MAAWRTSREPEWWAKAGVILQLIILVRTAAEFYRLRYVYGPTAALAAYQPYVGGLLIDAVLCLIAVLLLFWGKPVAAAITAAITVAVLLAYKVVAIT